MRATSLCLLLLAGCWVSPAEVQEKIDDRIDVATSDTDSPSDSESPTDTETETDSDDPTLQDLEIEDIEPSHGSNAGGTEVLITTDTDLGDEVTVTFAGVEATVIDIDGDQVTVETPSSSSTGIVAVKVVTETHDGRDRGFRYWEDGTGEYGIVGEIEWFEVMGDYWSDGNDPFSSAWIGIGEPDDTPHWERYYADDDDDACVLEYSTTPAELYSPSLTEVVVASSLGDTTLTGEEGYFSSDELNWSSHGEATLTLESEAVSDFPALDVDVASMPALPGLYYPAVDSSSLDYLYEDAVLYWDGSDAADYVIVRLIAIMGEDREEISCVVADDGEAWLNTASLWSDFDGSDYIIIYLGRVSLGGDTVEYDGSTSGVAGIAWEVGAAYPFSL